METWADIAVGSKVEIVVDCSLHWHCSVLMERMPLHRGYNIVVAVLHWRKIPVVVDQVHLVEETKGFVN